jgi:hypothetical protein
MAVVMWRLDPTLHPFPRCDELDRSLWDPDREIADCLDIVAQANHRCDDIYGTHLCREYILMNLLKFRSVHSGRLERWLGQEKIQSLSRAMQGWYGPPIHLLDCPGSVRVCKDGDFIGPFDRGVFMSAMDAVEQAVKRAGRIPRYACHTGFTGVANAIARALQGHPELSVFEIPLRVVEGFGYYHKVGMSCRDGVGAASSAPPFGR